MLCLTLEGCAQGLADKGGSPALAQAVAWCVSGTPELLLYRPCAPATLVAPMLPSCLIAIAVRLTRALPALPQCGQLTPIDLIVEERFHRAAPGGMGGTKAAGNYSPVRSRSWGMHADAFEMGVVKRRSEHLQQCHYMTIGVISRPLSRACSADVRVWQG